MCFRHEMRFDLADDTPFSYRREEVRMHSFECGRSDAARDNNFSVDTTAMVLARAMISCIFFLFFFSSWSFGRAEFRGWGF